MDWTVIKPGSCSEKPVTNFLSHGIVLQLAHSAQQRHSQWWQREEQDWCDSNGIEQQGQVNCPHNFDDITTGSGAAMTDDHVEKNSGYSWLQEGQDMQTVTPCPPPTESFLNWQVLTLTLDQVMHMIKLWKQWTLQESLSKLCTNGENKIHKFIFLKTIPQHWEFWLT
jgi:hypothetical protein